jgi:hypothetical protein
MTKVRQKLFVTNTLKTNLHWKNTREMKIAVGKLE